jgi:hypothetical protein
LLPYILILLSQALLDAMPTNVCSELFEIDPA